MKKNIKVGKIKSSFLFSIILILSLNLYFNLKASSDLEGDFIEIKVLDKINVDGLKEEDIPMLTKKAFDTIKVELENDPRKSAIKATEKWKKILA